MITNKINVDYLPVKINQKIINETFTDAKKQNKKVLGIVLATKPCFYKLWSVIDECKKTGLPYIIINTGQHYDDLVGHGIVEFNFSDMIAIDLQIRGDLSQKSAELFTKLSFFSKQLNKDFSDIKLIPYVNGDTLAAGIFPHAWLFATNIKSIQGEAALRGMSPENFKGLKENVDFDDFVKKQFDGNWIINRTEPFPEQVDTFISAAGCEYFFAPVQLNKDHLIREGYNDKNIFLSGNTVVDVIKLKKSQKSETSVFDLYPKLENDEWLRVDMHRRGNLTEKRFKSIIGGVKKLVEKGKNIVFIELHATKNALDYYGLRKDINLLQEKYDNFMFTPLWKEYAHVIEFINSEKCWGIMTDSGSMQEEMNELQKPCVTVRFNTDRPETVMDAKSNVLLPPLSKDFIANGLNNIYDNYRDQMLNQKKLYGSNVAEKTIEQIKTMFGSESNFFNWAHEELDIYKEDSDSMKYL